MIEFNTVVTLLDLRIKLSKIISRLQYPSQAHIDFIVSESLDFFRRDGLGEDSIKDALRYADNLDKLVTDIVANDFHFNAVTMANVVERICRSDWEFRLMSRLNRTPALAGGTPNRLQVLILYGEFM